jgi:hypothetical protein
MCLAPSPLSKAINQNWPALVTLLVSTAVYLFTLAPDLTWANASGDGGELITASYTLGIPHPPGYPTYTLLGKAFSFLPFGTVAWRYNLFSAVAMAMAAAFVTATVVILLSQAESVSRGTQAGARAAGRKRILAAIIAGLFFAFSPLVWQQAIVAEVYALNAFFVSLVLWATFRTRANSGARTNRRMSFVIGLLLGLALTTHLTSLLLLPMVMVFLSRRRITLFVAGMAIGLLPFLILPLLGQSGSPVRWGRPDSFDGWWWLVSGRLYRPNVLALPMSDWGPRLAQWGTAAGRSYSWMALPLIIAGSYVLWRAKRPRLILLVLLTVALYWLYAFTYSTNDGFVFFLPALLLLSILLGFGAGSHPGLGLFLLLLLVALNLPEQRLDVGSSIRPPAERLLQQVPREAIVLTPGDQTIATLWYFHHVEGERPDLIIIDGNLFQFGWYREQIAETYPDLRHLAVDDLEGFRQQNRLFRPVCDLSLVRPEANRCLVRE